MAGIEEYGTAAMSAGASIRLADFLRKKGIRYEWAQHRRKYFNWTRQTDGRIYVDPDEVEAYLATFVDLPANALTQSPGGSGD